MTCPFTVIDLTAWLDLIAEALRFQKPKVSDTRALKSAGNRAGKAALPPRYQNIRGSCFHRLQRQARTTAHYTPAARDVLIKDAMDCLEHLIERSTSVSENHDGLRTLAIQDFQTFRLALTGLMFPAPEERHSFRYRADIDA